MKKILTAFIFLTLAASLFSEEDIFTLNSKGDNLLLEGEYYSAIEKYKAVLEINPDFIHSVRGLAEAYYYLGEYEEAYKQVVLARKYDKNNIDLLSLEGRILLGKGDISAAEEIFIQIKKAEPNNINAYFGFAETALLTGKFTESRNNYLNILTISPSNRKALLSIIILYDYQRQFNESENYVAEALRIYNTDPVVLYIASRHYIMSGNTHLAEIKIRESLKLDPDFLDAALLYSKILLKNGEYASVPGILNRFYSKRDNNIVAYTLGRAAEKNGETDSALRFYSEAYKINPDDEVSRFALENLIRFEKDINDPVRTMASEYHYLRGRGLEERNYINKALNSYRRALLIDPNSVKVRLAYSRIFLNRGFRAKYLSELYTLPERERNYQHIKDDIEIQESLQSSSVSSVWKTDQFLVNKHKFNINLYFRDSFSMIHQNGESVLSEVFKSIAGHSENLEIINQISRIDGFAQAFSESRNGKNSSDYFLILDFSETERLFSVNCSVYSSFTGAEIADYRIIKTGNNRIWDSLNNLMTEILSDINVYGQIIGLEFEKGLINIGKLESVKKDDNFLIVRKDRIKIDRSRIGYTFEDADVIGTLKITETDESVSEGTISGREMFDLVNYGDIVIKDTGKEEEKKEIKEDYFSKSDIYEFIINIK